MHQYLNYTPLSMSEFGGGVPKREMLCREVCVCVCVCVRARGLCGERRRLLTGQIRGS